MLSIACGPFGEIESVRAIQDQQPRKVSAMGFKQLLFPIWINLVHLFWFHLEEAVDACAGPDQLLRNRQ